MKPSHVKQRLRLNDCAVFKVDVFYYKIKINLLEKNVNYKIKIVNKTKCA